MMATVSTYVPRTRRNVEALLLVVAVALSTAAYALVGIGSRGAPTTDTLNYGLGLLGVALVMHLAVRWRAKFADPLILPVVTLINGLGLALINSVDVAKSIHLGIDTSYGPRQLIWMYLGVALAAALVVLLREYRILRRYTYVSALAGLILLLMPLLPFVGREINGARIWIFVAGFSFQPGELAKICFAIFFAGYLVSRRDTLSLSGRKVIGLQLPRWRDLGPILVLWVASVLVLVFETDLGTSLLFFGLFVAMIYIATERLSWIIIGAGLIGALAIFGATKLNHVQERFAGWLHPFDPAVYNREYGSSQQLVSGLFGMANGGLTGTGLGAGRPDLVPFAESDFIVSTLGEELGLAGMFAVLALYGILVERALRAAIGVNDGFGKLLAGGLAFTIALQCFVVAGGVTRVIPLTGLTMPFLAYGGSSLISNWIIVGLLLKISDASRRPAPGPRRLGEHSEPAQPGTTPKEATA